LHGRCRACGTVLTGIRVRTELWLDGNRRLLGPASRIRTLPLGCACPRPRCSSPLGWIASDLWAEGLRIASELRKSGNRLRVDPSSQVRVLRHIGDACHEVRLTNECRGLAALRPRLSKAKFPDGVRRDNPVITSRELSSVRVERSLPFPPAKPG
jgi:hypothetical protein